MVGGQVQLLLPCPLFYVLRQRLSCAEIRLPKGFNALVSDRL